MSTITVDGDITFHYTDSGPVDRGMNEYTTLVMVHGISFHSGIFARLQPRVNLHGFRMICVSRRPYLESTPYTSEDIEIIRNGSEEERATFINTQGVLLALFLDAIIQRHALSETGGIALVGCSMGNLFILAVLGSICSLPSGTRERLKHYLHSYICWDAPSVVLGIPLPEGSYIPFLEPSIRPQDRGAIFRIWMSGYFQHGDISSREYGQLNQRDFDTQVRKPTLTTMTDEEIRSTANASGAKFDTPIVIPGPFAEVLRNLTSQALFNSQTRDEWTRLKICLMYGENSSWIVIYAMWVLEGRARQTGIDLELIPGANHFMMWDAPEKFMVCLKKFISKSRTRACML